MLIIDLDWIIPCSTIRPWMLIVNVFVWSRVVHLEKLQSKIWGAVPMYSVLINRYERREKKVQRRRLRFVRLRKLNLSTWAWDSESWTSFEKKIEADRKEGDGWKLAKLSKSFCQVIKSVSAVSQTDAQTQCVCVGATTAKGKKQLLGVCG